MNELIILLDPYFMSHPLGVLPYIYSLFILYIYMCVFKTVVGSYFHFFNYNHMYILYCV